MKEKSGQGLKMSIQGQKHKLDRNWIFKIYELNETYS